MLPSSKPLKMITDGIYQQLTEENILSDDGGWCDDLYSVALTHEEILNLYKLGIKNPALQVTDEELV